jgi:hypothetical protein
MGLGLWGTIRINLRKKGVKMVVTAKKMATTRNNPI